MDELSEMRQIIDSTRKRMLEHRIWPYMDFKDELELRCLIIWLTRTGPQTPEASATTAGTSAP